MPVNIVLIFLILIFPSISCSHCAQHLNSDERNENRSKPFFILLPFIVTLFSFIQFPLYFKYVCFYNIVLKILLEVQNLNYLHSKIFISCCYQKNGSLYQFTLLKFEGKSICRFVIISVIFFHQKMISL